MNLSGTELRLVIRSPFEATFGVIDKEGNEVGFLTADAIYRAGLITVVAEETRRISPSFLHLARSEGVIIL